MIPKLRATSPGGDIISFNNLCFLLTENWLLLSHKVGCVTINLEKM